MGAHSKIEWTTHTFNPWCGCRGVSPACDHCYAEAWSRRAGRDFGQRVRTTAANWRKPLAWDRAAAAAGRRDKVFCASLADVFDAEVSDDWRDDLFALIALTPNLDWLLLTKRPKVARDYLVAADLNSRVGIAGESLPGGGFRRLPSMPTANMWLGITVENQTMADLRIPLLLATPAAKRFLSCEPLLGGIGLENIRPAMPHWRDADHYNALTGRAEFDCDDTGSSTVVGCCGPRLDWIIAGGESGPKARPMHPDWVRGLRDQGVGAGVPFFFKQWGEWAPLEHSEAEGKGNWWLMHSDGSIEPPDHRWPEADAGEAAMLRVGKARAGALLDGREHRESPAP